MSKCGKISTEGIRTQKARTVSHYPAKGGGHDDIQRRVYTVDHAHRSDRLGRKDHKKREMTAQVGKPAVISMHIT